MPGRTKVHSSRGRVEGDGIAEGFQVVDVGADGALGAATDVVEVRAEVDEGDRGVGEQVPDDGQDGAADGDDGLLLASWAGDPPVPFAEERVGLAGVDGGLTQGVGQVAVAVAGGVLALLLPGGLLMIGENFAQDARCPAVGNRPMSTPTSATIT